MCLAKSFVIMKKYIVTLVVSFLQNGNFSNALQVNRLRPSEDDENQWGDWLIDEGVDQVMPEGTEKELVRRGLKAAKNKVIGSSTSDKDKKSGKRSKKKVKQDSGMSRQVLSYIIVGVTLGVALIATIIIGVCIVRKKRAKAKKEKLLLEQDEEAEQNLLRYHDGIKKSKSSSSYRHLPYHKQQVRSSYFDDSSYSNLGSAKSSSSQNITNHRNRRSQDVDRYSYRRGRNSFSSNSSRQSFDSDDYRQHESYMTDREKLFDKQVLKGRQMDQQFSRSLSKRSLPQPAPEPSYKSLRSLSTTRSKNYPNRSSTARPPPRAGSTYSNSVDERQSSYNLRSRKGLSPVRHSSSSRFMLPERSNIQDHKNSWDEYERSAVGTPEKPPKISKSRSKYNLLSFENKSSSSANNKNNDAKVSTRGRSLMPRSRAQQTPPVTTRNKSSHEYRPSTPEKKKSEEKGKSKSRSKSKGRFDFFGGRNRSSSRKK